MVLATQVSTHSSPPPILLPIIHLEQRSDYVTFLLTALQRLLLAYGIKHQTQPGIYKASHHLAATWPFSVIACQFSGLIPDFPPSALSAKHCPPKAVIRAQNIPLSLLLLSSQLLFIFPFLAEMSLSPDCLLWFISAFSHPSPFPHQHLNICCSDPGMLLTVIMATSIN